MAPMVRISAVQFGLRAILGCTAAVAVFFAVAAPSLHAWSGTERQAFLTVWITAFVTGGGFVVSYCLLRLRAERRAGRLRYVLPLLNARPWYWTSAVLFVAVVGLVVVMSLMQQRQALLFAEMMKQGGTHPFSAWWSIPPGISAGMPLAMSGTLLWWRALRIELCEHGIVYFSAFLPWSSFSCQLEGEPALLTVRVVSNRFSTRLRARVPREVLPQVRELLETASLRHPMA
jgi:hypothetical protein